MAQKQLRLRRADRCRACGDDLPVGSSQWWDADARAVTCVACHDRSPVAPAEVPPPAAAPVEAPPVLIAPEIPPTPRVIGDGGASAQREYDRRSSRAGLMAASRPSSVWCRAIAVPGAAATQIPA